MMRMAQLGLVLVAVMLAGCGTPARDVADPVRVAKARAVVTALEQRLDALRNLPPAERRQAYLALQPELERAVEETDNLPLVSKKFSAEERSGSSFADSGLGVVTYNYHAKALFWLANWRLLYAGGVGTEALLDRLDRQMSQAMHLSSQSLRVQLYLRTGRIVEARRLAEELVVNRRMAEMSGLLELVAWFERVGQAAPRVADRNLAGGAADPLGGGAPFVLMVFTQSDEPETAYYLERLRTAIAAVPASRRPRLAHVTFEGSPLRAARLIRPEEDLMWANPNAEGSAPRWQAAWRIPDPLPRNVLVGPDRTVLAVEMTPEQVAELGR